MFKDSVPPVISNALLQMYQASVLQVACTGWSRVGFNEELAQALRAVGGNVQGGGPVLPTPIPTPGSKSQLLGKRYRGGGGQTKGSRKKRKGK